MAENVTTSGNGIKKAECILDLLLGISYLISTLMGYFPAFTTGEFIYLGEWCCITGIIGSIYYFVSFFCGMKGKRLPEYLHLDVTVMLSLIFIATVTIRLNLEGVFWFIHLFGPIIVLTRFLLFCDCRKTGKTALVLTSIIFPCIYIFFAFCLLKMTGDCPFPARLILMWDNPLMPIGIVVVLCILILIVGFGFFCLNRFVNSKRNF